jgi:SAM-dependent methyltransferase
MGPHNPAKPGGATMSMLDLDAIYDADFFSQWGRTNRDYVESARVIAVELFDQFRPGRMVDLGCGCGVHAHFFQQLGVEVVCVDGVRPPAAVAFGLEVQLRDLTVPFENPWGPFDLALCLDVAEHIPEALCDPFLATITGFADTLLFAGAPPGQGGHHHVNEQPKRWWNARLRAHGFAYDRPATGRLCEAFKLRRPPLMWMGEHISVYHRLAA